MGAFAGHEQVRLSLDRVRAKSGGHDPNERALPIAAGRALMDVSRETLFAADFFAASLWVLDMNARAIGFYQALGWRSDGAVKHDIMSGTPIRDLRYRRALA